MQALLNPPAGRSSHLRYPSVPGGTRILLVMGLTRRVNRGCATSKCGTNVSGARGLRSTSSAAPAALVGLHRHYLILPRPDRSDHGWSNCASHPVHVHTTARTHQASVQGYSLRGPILKTHPENHLPDCSTPLLAQRWDWQFALQRPSLSLCAMPQTLMRFETASRPSTMLKQTTAS
jgi:hypothetical protein